MGPRLVLGRLGGDHFSPRVWGWSHRRARVYDDLALLLAPAGWSHGAPDGLKHRVLLPARVGMAAPTTVRRARRDGPRHPGTDGAHALCFPRERGWSPWIACVIRFIDCSPRERGWFPPGLPPVRRPLPAVALSWGAPEEADAPPWRGGPRCIPHLRYRARVCSGSRDAP